MILITHGRTPPFIVEGLGSALSRLRSFALFSGSLYNVSERRIWMLLHSSDSLFVLYYSNSVGKK